MPPIKDFSFLVDLLISAGLGAFVGLRNEITHAKIGKQMIGGIRSYAFLGILGYLIGKLTCYAPVIGSIIVAASVALVVIYYIDHLWRRKATSLSMELSALVTLLFSFLFGFGLITLKIAIGIAIITVGVISFKENLKRFAFALDEWELKEFILFAVMGLLLLPWLPNTEFSLVEILSFIGVKIPIDSLYLSVEFLNPYRVGLVLAVVLGVNLLGYFVAKYSHSAKKWLLQSAVSGFFSSTATTVALASQSKIIKNLHLVILGILLANLASFVEVILLSSAFNLRFTSEILKITTVMLAVGGVYFVFYFKKNKKQVSKLKIDLKPHNFLHFSIALRFVAFYIVARYLIKILSILYGSEGALISLIALGFTGIDLATLNTAIFIKDGVISLTQGLLVFLGVNLVNFVAKVVYISLTKPTREFLIESIKLFILLSLGVILGYALVAVPF